MFNFTINMPRKKKIKISIGSAKEIKAEAPVENPKVAEFRKLMEEAKTPQKMLEYRFWMEVHQGKNPEIPVHMR